MLPLCGELITVYAEHKRGAKSEGLQPSGGLLPTPSSMAIDTDPAIIMVSNI